MALCNPLKYYLGIHKTTLNCHVLSNMLPIPFGAIALSAAVCIIAGIAPLFVEKMCCDRGYLP